MSNATQKADQIAYRFYTKLASIVNNARATADPKPQPKLDKWFNLETPDSDLFKEHLRIYRAVSVAPLPPPLKLQVLLVVPELSHDQVLVHLSPDMSRLRVEPTPRYILLESWVLSFTSIPYHEQHNLDIAPSTIYKHGIPLFRSLYSLLRILPSWKFSKRLRRRTGGANRSSNLSIELSIPTSQDDHDSVLGFDTAPARGAAQFHTETHQFPPVPHPTGTLSLAVTYLTTPNFQLDELESLLSSRFLSLDEGPDFTPTLAKNQQQHSVSGSSLPVRTSLPLSPASSVADRFVLPTRVASLGVSPRNVPLPIARSTSATGAESHSGPSAGSSAWSKDDNRPLSSIAAARLRRESLGRGGDLPSAPSPLPIRRPNINPVHPFKASTLSSGSPSHHSPSPSLRQSSPLSSLGAPALPARPVHTSPPSSRIPLPGLVNRPSPPFAPSSLGDRRSIASAEGDDTSPRPNVHRKRYSSSFGHRYAATGGAGSEGSAGSGDRREGERVGSASFLSTNTDDDEISIFVQEIDSRKPLSARHRTQEDREQEWAESHRRTASAGQSEGVRAGIGSRSPRENRSEGSSRSRSDESGRGARGGTGNNGGRDNNKNGESGVGRGTGTGIDAGSGSSASEPMLTNESDVDERLRQMNIAFLASLEGLGTRRERRQGDGGNSRSESLPEGRSGGGGGGSGRRGRIPTLEEEQRGMSEGRDVRRRDLGENLLLRQPLHDGGSGSGSTSISSAGLGQGSDEVIGRLELDDERRLGRR